MNVGFQNATGNTEISAYFPRPNYISWLYEHSSLVVDNPDRYNSRAHFVSTPENTANVIVIELTTSFPEFNNGPRSASFRN